MTAKAIRRPTTIPGKNPARTAPAGNLFGWRVGSIVTGLLEPVGVDVEEGAFEVAVGLLVVELAVDVGARFV